MREKIFVENRIWIYIYEWLTGGIFNKQEIVCSES